MKRCLLFLLILAIALLSGCRQEEKQIPDAAATTDPTLPLTVIHPTETDAPETAGETPTGRIYDSEGVIGKTCLLADIVDFSLIENAGSLTADYIDETRHRQISREEWDRDVVAALLTFLRACPVTVTTAADTAEDPVCLGLYFEGKLPEDTTCRFSLLQTSGCCYLAFDWMLLRGVELDDPALLFRAEDDRIGDLFPASR